MTPELLPLSFAFAFGAVVAGIITALLSQRWADGRSRREIERLSAAEALAENERVRRAELESELDGALESIRRLDRELAVARERVERTAGLLDEQKDFLERARQQLSESFQAMAGEALKGNTQQFLALAGQTLGGGRTRATAELDERK